MLVNAEIVPPLLTLDNVVLTPHVGWTTVRIAAAFVAETVINVESYL